MDFSQWYHAGPPWSSTLTNSSLPAEQCQRLVEGSCFGKGWRQSRPRYEDSRPKNKQPKNIITHVNNAHFDKI